MRAVYGDIQGLQSLLTVKDHTEGLARCLGLGNEDNAGMKIRHEVTIWNFKESSLPEKQGTKWIATHYGVHEQPNLIPTPNEITLQIRQNKLLIEVDPGIRTRISVKQEGVKSR